MRARLTDGEYTVRLVDMPDSVAGATAIDSDGHANVYLNARLSFEARKKALRHELRHVERDDAYNDTDIREAEKH